MSSLVVCDEGERWMLDRAMRTAWTDVDVITLRLFVNDFEPHANMEVDELTEATFPGYAPVDLTPSEFTLPVTVLGSAVTYYQSVPQRFEADSGMVQVYGYYYTVNGGGTLFGAQRFDSVVFASAGSPVFVYPQITLHSDSQPPP